MSTKDIVKMQSFFKTEMDRHFAFERSANQQVIADAIEKNVNGKIRRLDEKIDNYIVQDTQWKEQDKLWKATAQPSVELGQSAIGFGKGLKWITATLIAVYAVIKIFWK